MTDHISLDMIDTDGADPGGRGGRRPGHPLGLLPQEPLRGRHARRRRPAHGRHARRWPRQAVGQAGHPDPQLRADARVPRGRVLQAAIGKRRAVGPALDLAKVIAKHERDHVVFLKKALGRKAVKSPTFDFGDTVTDQASSSPRRTCSRTPASRPTSARPGASRTPPTSARPRRSSPSRPGTPARSRS